MLNCVNDVSGTVCKLCLGYYKGPYRTMYQREQSFAWEPIYSLDLGDACCGPTPGDRRSDVSGFLTSPQTSFHTTRVAH